MIKIDKEKLQARRERFLRDPMPTRLGNLASNLTRLKAFTQRPEMGEAARRIVYESKHFSEWAARDASLPIQVELLALQKQLIRWQFNWQTIWNDPQKRQELMAQTDRWSAQILQRSGLLNPAHL